MEKIKMAHVKGNNWSDWEAPAWKEMRDALDITVFCAKNNENKIDHLDFKTVRVPCSYDNFFLKNYYKYVKGEYKTMFGLEKMLGGFDVAHGVELYNYFTLQAIRAKKYNPNLKVVVHVNDNMPGRFEYNYWPGFKMPPKYWRDKINGVIQEVVKGADLFLAVTQYSADVLADFGVPKNKIKVLGPAIVVSKDVDKDELFKKLNIPDGKELYMVVNRLVKEKGIYDVLYGWKMYMREIGPVAGANKLLLVAGKGPEKENIERLIKEWGLESNVKMLSFLPNVEVRTLYKYAKCFLLGSIPTNTWQEQYGYVLAEAITCDCPVISTWSGAIPEVVGNAGILVSPGNCVEIKDALKKMDHPQYHAQLKANCATMKINYSMAHFKETLLAAYNELLNR